MLLHELVDLGLAGLPGLIRRTAIKAREAGGGFLGFDCGFHDHLSVFVFTHTIHKGFKSTFLTLPLIRFRSRFVTLLPPPSAGSPLRG